MSLKYLIFFFVNKLILMGSIFYHQFLNTHNPQPPEKNYIYATDSCVTENVN